MKRRNKSSGGGVDSNAWMNTYADLVTLLMCFFVLLFTMSSVDAEKWQMLIRAFTNKGGETSQLVMIAEGEGNDMAENAGEKPPASEDDTPPAENQLPIDFDELYKYIKAYIDRNELGGSVEIQKNENSVFIRFKDNIFFEADSPVLKSTSYEVLDFLGDCFKSVEEQVLSIRINGHTAAIPGVEDYKVSDRTLSSDRANSVLLYFEQIKKVEPKKLISIGYGKNYPVASNDTPEGREKNRRVDMMILSNQLAEESTEDLYQLLLGSFDIELYPDHENPEDVLIPDSSNPSADSKEGAPVYQGVSPYDTDQ